MIKRIKTIKDIYSVCKQYFGKPIGIQRTDTEDGKNRVVYRLIVGFKKNPTFDPTIDVNQIFKGDKQINQYLENKLGVNWNEKVKKEDLEKLIALANKKGLDTSRVIVEVANSRPKTADIRVINVTPNMTVEALVENHLKGIKKSLAKKENIIDEEITTLDNKKKENDIDPDEIAQMVESGEEIVPEVEDGEDIDFIGADEELSDEDKKQATDTEDFMEEDDDDIDDLSDMSGDEDILNDDEEDTKEEPADAQSEEEGNPVVDAINKLNDNMDKLANKFESVEIRLDQLEDEKKPRKKKAKSKKK